jgi:hypothetical protein
MILIIEAQKWMGGVKHAKIGFLEASKMLYK